MAWMFPVLILSQGLLPSVAPDTGSMQTRWIDVDGDGRFDFHLLDGAGSQRLFFADAHGFREAAAEELAGIGAARFALWSDVDRDGLPELLTGTPDGALRLARAPRGVLEPYELGLEALAGVRAAEWVDFDQDGWTDLWVQREEEWALLANRGVRGGRTFVLVPGGRLAPATPARAAAASPSSVLPHDAVPADAPEKSADPARAALPSAEPGARIPGSSTKRATAVSRPSPPSADPPPDVAPATFYAPCARTLFNEANGGCLSASSAPALGKLYPLSSFLNVDASGRVGVGTTSPTHRLTVSAPDDDALRLIGAGVFGSQSRLNFGDGDFVYLFEDNDDALEIHTQDGLRITGGNVGIGTLFPSWPLHVVAAGQAVGRFDSQGTSFGSVIELRNQTAGASDVGAINFVNSLGQFNGQIAYKGNDALTFRSGGAERMRLDASGRLGIGTTAPGYPVDIRGAAQVFLPLVEVEETGAALFTTALEGRTSSSTGIGLSGFNQSTTAGIGVSGVSNGGTGRGVSGAHAGGGVGYGVHGSSQSGSGYGVFSAGDFGGTGAKYFVQPHPRDPSKEIRFVSLEGNESGTYFRGSARLAGGRAVIDVPEEFRLVTEPEGLTVQVTPIGQAVPLAVESYDLERVAVVGPADVEFHYFVNGVRRGFAELECVRENHAYVPEERGVPYGAQYPDALRKILVENGTLDPDFTPSEATAARLGWELRDPARQRTAGGEPR